MNVVAYYRYSTDNKNQVDNSEDRQKDIVENLVYSRARQGWKLICSYTDKSVSGTDDKPELLRLKEAVESGDLKVDIIAIDALSRLSRRSLIDIGSDIQWMKQSGIKLCIASKNNGEPFTIDDFEDDLALMVDQYQNNQFVKKLSREVTNGLRTKFSKGTLGWVGKAPYGYDLKRSIDEPTSLIPNDDLPLIEEIFRKFLAGYSIRSLISVLEKTEQYKNGNYIRPNSTTVKNILRSSIYAGIRTFGVRGVGKHNTVSGVKRNSLTMSSLVQADSYQEYAPEGFESVITVDEYNQVQDILDSNAKAFRKFPERHAHKYSGLLRCLHCDAPLTAVTWKNPKTGEEKISYTCPASGDGTDNCKDGDRPFRKAIRTDELDWMIARELFLIVFDREFHLRNLLAIAERLDRRSETSLAAVEENLAIQERRLDEIWRLWEESGSDSLKRKLDEQSQKIDELRNKVRESTSRDELLEIAESQFRSGEDRGGFQGYFGIIYPLAVNVAGFENSEDRNEMANFGADKLVELFSKSLVKRTPSGNETKLTVEQVKDWDFENGTISYAKKPFTKELTLASLKAMGIDHIKVGWQLGLYRGKPRRIPSELSFAFSITCEERIFKGLLVMCKQNAKFLSFKSS